MEYVIFIVIFSLMWMLGNFIGAYIIIQMIIIVCFGIPYSFELKNTGVLKNYKPIFNYLTSLIILSITLIVVWFLLYKYLAKYIIGFYIGVAISILLGIGKCGKNLLNLTDYYRVNKKYLNEDF